MKPTQFYKVIAMNNEYYSEIETFENIDEAKGLIARLKQQDLELGYFEENRRFFIKFETLYEVD